MVIRNWQAAKALELDIPRSLFERHEQIGLVLDGLCADFVPTAVEQFNASAFSGLLI